MKLKLAKPTIPQPLKKPVQLIQIAYTLLLFHLLAIFAWLVVIAPLYLQPESTGDLENFFATMDFSLSFLLIFIFLGSPLASLAAGWFSRYSKLPKNRNLTTYFWIHLIWFICHCVLLIAIAKLSNGYVATGSWLEVVGLSYPAVLYPLFAMAASVQSVLIIRNFPKS
jgi:hypothetical protein